MTLQEFAFWQVVVMVPAITSIPVLYHRRQAWWHDWYGRVFMTLAVGLVLLVNFAVTFQFIPEFPAKDAIKVGVYCVLLVAFYSMAVLMWRVPSGRGEQS